MAGRTRGLFGGTFDPPHLGHVAAARAAVEALRLDELVVTVARDPQRKGAPPLASPEQRDEMARAAFEGVDRVVVSDLELRRAGPTYTVDTVESLLDERPGDALTLVLGADAAAALGSWHRADELARLVDVAVVPRPGTPIAVPQGFSVRIVPMAPVDLSSSAVRAALAAGEDPAEMVPPGVVRILLTHPLYAP
ncbi:MAG TPA: nicotinate (nicotinamide) nucleotide adenylyltransferase [Acidimicrobiales bacterium]|nr:nicotinate (nicotinamide) nucleotide adenylyltransferase [Acidimicrobiales bacterium]